MKMMNRNGPKALSSGRPEVASYGFEKTGLLNKI